MKNPLILIAEDTPEILMVLIDLLELEGYRVHTAGDGQSALDYLINCNKCPDLLITDIMMPRLGGLDLLDKVKDLAHLSTMKLAVYSASAHFKKTAEQKGAVFISKPFDMDELLATLKQLAPTDQGGHV